MRVRKLTGKRNPGDIDRNAKKIVEKVKEETT